MTDQALQIIPEPPVAWRGGEAHAWAGFALAADAAVLRLNEEFGLDLWLVTAVEDEAQVVIAARGPWSSTLGPSIRLVWAQSFCTQMVSGAAPAVAPKVEEDPVYAAVARDHYGDVGAYLGVPLLRGENELFGSLCAFAGTAQPATLERALPMATLIARMLSTILTREVLAAERSAAAAAAYALADRDPLTGLRNRRGWDAALHQESARCQRSGAPASVLLVTVPRPGAGTTGLGYSDSADEDQLRRCGLALQEACRPTDVIGRLGSEEFAVLAVESDAVEARALGVRIRRKLRSCRVPVLVATVTRRRGEDLKDTYRRGQLARLAPPAARVGDSF